MNLVSPDFSSTHSASPKDFNDPQSSAEALNYALTRRMVAPVRASVIAPGLRELRLWELPEGAVGRCELTPEDRVSLTGVEGQCWVTQQGDRLDYLLTPGKTLVFSGPGRLVFEAVAGSATLAVS